MTKDMIRRATVALMDKYDLHIEIKYDSKSDDMSGFYAINGRESTIPYPCSVHQLYHELYWYYRMNVNINMFIDEAPTCRCQQCKYREYCEGYYMNFDTCECEIPESFIKEIR